MIINTNNLVWLKEQPDNSIDHIITDPPYLIDFMGKGWDSEDNIAGNPEFWKECLRVVKSGGYCLAFGHSRTHHRVMSALEDAGWEIRDCLMWLYGSGFPKSHNLSSGIDKKKKLIKHRGKAIPTASSYQATDKEQKNKLTSNPVPPYEPISAEAKEWEGWGSALKPAYEPIIMARKPFKGSLANNVLEWGLGGLNINACRVGTEVMPAITTKTETTEIGWEKRGYTTPEAVGRFPANVMLSHSEGCKKVAETTEIEEAKEITTKSPKFRSWSDDPTKTRWHNQGFNKLEGNNYTTKGRQQTIDIYECEEGCPVKELDDQSGITKSSKRSAKHNKKTEGTNTYTPPQAIYDENNTYGDKGGASRFFQTWECEEKKEEHKGRHPANIMLSHSEGCKQVGETTETIVGGNKGKSGFAKGYESGDFTTKQSPVELYDCEDDCPVKLLDEQAPKVGNVAKAKRKKDTTGGSGNSWTNGGKKEGEDNGIYDGLAGASRFFYCAKVSAKERNFGVENRHPTIKPIELMKWLVKLVSKEGQTILDPFAGSGSTGIAVELLGREFVGLELDPDYCDIAERRIEVWLEKEKT